MACLGYRKQVVNVKERLAVGVGRTPSLAHTAEAISRH